MADLVFPAALAGVEPVRSIRTPIRLDYQFTAGQATSKFLRNLTDKRVTGQRCPKCKKVYVPPRGTYPTDGVPTTDEVELAHTGVLTSYAIVNVQFYGQAMEVPYVSGMIVLDGADTFIFHLIQEIPVEEIRMGLRVEAVWVDADENGKVPPSLESIAYFRPTGEPDAAYETYKEHL